MGEGLVELSHVQWHTWTCGGVAHSFSTAVKQLSEPKKCRQDCLMLSAQSFYGPCLRSVAYSLTCCFPGNVTLLHMSKYVNACDSVLPGLPRASTGSDKRWGEKAWVQGYAPDAAMYMHVPKFLVALVTHKTIVRNVTLSVGRLCLHIM